MSGGHLPLTPHENKELGVIQEVNFLQNGVKKCTDSIAISLMEAPGNKCSS